MNEQRFVVTDDVWQRLEPHLRGKASDAGAMLTVFCDASDVGSEHTLQGFSD